MTTKVLLASVVISGLALGIVPSSASEDGSKAPRAQAGPIELTEARLDKVVAGQSFVQVFAVNVALSTAVANTSCSGSSTCQAIATSTVGSQNITVTIDDGG